MDTSLNCYGLVLKDWWLNSWWCCWLLWTPTNFVCPFLPWSCFYSHRYTAYYDCSRM